MTHRKKKENTHEREIKEVEWNVTVSAASPSASLRLRLRRLRTGHVVSAVINLLRLLSREMGVRDGSPRAAGPWTANGASWRDWKSVFYYLFLFVFDCLEFFLLFPPLLLGEGGVVLRDDFFFWGGGSFDFKIVDLMFGLITCWENVLRFFFFFFFPLCFDLGLPKVY